MSNGRSEGPDLHLFTDSWHVVLFYLGLGPTGHERTSSFRGWTPVEGSPDGFRPRSDDLVFSEEEAAPAGATPVARLGQRTIYRVN